MKKIVFLLATISSFSAFSQQPINCTFTEPFIDFDIDVVNQTVVRNEPDWENENGGVLSTDISAQFNFVSTLKNGVANLVLSDKQTGKKVFDASLNFKGSDGMSDNTYAYDVKYNREQSSLYGGCSSESLKPVNVEALDATQAAFYKIAEKAITQCYARAAGAWTSEISENKKESVFAVLYKTDKVPGEPGNISRQLTKAEKKTLAALAADTAAVPMVGAEFKRHRELKFAYCDGYAGILQKRYEAKE